MTYTSSTPPVATAGQVNLAALNFYLQIPPQIEKKIYQEMGEPTANIYTMLKLFGRRILATPPYYTAEAEGRITGTVTTTGGTSFSADTDATFTIAAADHINGETYPIVSDIITFPSNNYAQGRVMAKSTTVSTAHTITVHLLDPTLAFTVSSGTVLHVTSQMSADGTGAPQGRKNFPSKRNFYFQITKEGLKQDGTTLVIPTYSQPGGTFNPLWQKVRIRLERNVAGALLLGDEVTSTMPIVTAEGTWGTQGVGNTPSGTKGLWRHAKALGNSATVAAGAEALTDFRDIKEYLLTQGMNPLTCIAIGGHRRVAAYSTAIKAANANGGADYIKGILAGDPNTGERAGYISFFDFASYQEGSTNFTLSEAAEFTDPHVLGGSTYNGTNQMLVMPLTTVRSSKNPDVSWPNFAIMHVGNAGYSREMEEITIAGAGGGIYNTEVDEKGSHLRTHYGMFVMGGNQLSLIAP